MKRTNYNVASEYEKAIQFVLVAADNPEYIFIEKYRILITISKNSKIIKLAFMRSMDDEYLNTEAGRNACLEAGTTLVNLLNATAVYAPIFRGLKIKICFNDGDFSEVFDLSTYAKQYFH